MLRRVYGEQELTSAESRVAPRNLMAQRASVEYTPLPTPRRMSEAEFLAWTADTDVRAEWADGEAIQLMPPDERHQDLSGFLLELLRVFVRKFGLGKMLDAPFEMRLQSSSNRSYREP